MLKQTTKKIQIIDRLILTLTIISSLIKNLHLLVSCYYSFPNALYWSLSLDLKRFYLRLIAYDAHLEPVCLLQSLLPKLLTRLHACTLSTMHVPTDLVICLLSLLLLLRKPCTYTHVVQPVSQIDNFVWILWIYYSIVEFRIVLYHQQSLIFFRLQLLKVNIHKPRNKVFTILQL